MEDQFSKSRPAALHFFSHETPTVDQQPFTVSIHKWALGSILESDTTRTIKSLAQVIVKEVAGTSLTLTGELVFSLPRLLPSQPLWDDGCPLFAAQGTDAEDRFGVPGGNIVESMNCFSEDVANAVDRLVELDASGSYDSEERLRVFCSKPLERKLMRACAKAGVKSKVFGLRDYKDERSWVVARDVAPCSMLMTTPSFDLPVKGSTLTAGAKYVVWINSPRLAVCVTPKETE